MEPIAVTRENFQQEVLDSPAPVLADFWAPWCGPCRMAAPVLEALSEEYAGRVTFGKLNIDENADAAIALGVMSIPTLVLFKDGKEVDRLIGMQGKPAFQSLIEKHLA